MMHDEAQSYTAFDGHALVAQGRLEEVAIQVKRKARSRPSASILVFSDSTGKQMDFDLRGSDADVLQRLQVYLTPEEAGPPAAPGPGRPKLGVVGREVSLLPRHWEWLSTQAGGASATLRRLVEDARKTSSGRDRAKKAQERAHRFMSSLAGDLPGFEEALRALYAGDKAKFRTRIGAWPRDVRAHAMQLAEGAFGSA